MLKVEYEVTFEDNFTVAYTSGSTNEKRPKAIVQRVRSFCDIGRFHDPDLTYGLKMKQYRCNINKITKQNALVVAEMLHEKEIANQKDYQNRF